MTWRGELDSFVNLFVNICGTTVAMSGALTLQLPGGRLGASNVTYYVHSRTINGMCVTYLFGNLYYAFMAKRLMMRTGRSDVCCLPYGISTPVAAAFVFNVVGAAAREAAMVDDSAMTAEDVVIHAWRIGCVANLLGGAIATLCSFVGPTIVRLVPKAALLSALAAIAFTWLGIQQVIVCFAVGYGGLLPLAVAMAIYFAGLKTGAVPGSVFVLFSGTCLGWVAAGTLDIAWEGGGTVEMLKAAFTQQLGFHPPIPLDLGAFTVIGQVVTSNLSVVLPLAVTGAMGTLLVVYQAAEAGDEYPLREVMLVDGLTTMTSALFGSPFATCVYLGHSAFKERGASWLYAVMTAVFYTLFSLTGLFAVVQAIVPPYAIAPVLLFIGLAINKDSFIAIPQRHLPAAIFGYFPTVAEWSLSFWGDSQPRSASVEFWGLRAVSRGAFLVGIIWTSILAHLIDRQFFEASGWALIGALFSAVGLIHQPELDIKPFLSNIMKGFSGTCELSFVVGYGFLAAFFLILKLLQLRGLVEPSFKDDEEAALRDDARRIHEQYASSMEPLSMCTLPSSSASWTAGTTTRGSRTQLLHSGRRRWDAAAARAEEGLHEATEAATWCATPETELTRPPRGEGRRLSASARW